jgi:hypothetical protein
LRLSSSKVSSKAFFTLDKEIISAVIRGRRKKINKKLRFLEMAGSSEVLQKLYNYKAVPKKSIQRKINYYMTPYVSDLTFKKWMKFEGIEQDNEKWANVFDFIVKEKNEMFRASMSSIKQRLRVDDSEPIEENIHCKSNIQIVPFPWFSQISKKKMLMCSMIV